MMVTDTDTHHNDDVQRAKGLVRAASRVLVLTGAGISTDSGIPDFRGPDGLWTKNPGAEEASDISIFRTDAGARKAFWKMMLMMRSIRPEPNPGHRALLDLERQGKLLLIVTQNVDGLHQLAGSSEGLVVEVHGGTHQSCCLSCGDLRDVTEALQRVEEGEEEPCCKQCGGLLKANVVLFGEQLPEAALARAELAARECDLLLCVGSTLSVYPIAGIVPRAKQAGASVIILNKGETDFDDLADVRLEGSISEMLPELCRAADEESKL
eukprot:TRINITY_DN63414_c0_g1_i1.p1 TRINITY_DN63414_c0_g1~~TRINITY_DN63414_c0_g1_i1.p1  ORF type:complete len:267 (+),score=53.59 TRINITY_DN63414_c0_g1_i1:80-880(+)